MIVLVTGPPGAGKSLYAVRKLGEALDRGLPVATNVQLADDAPERVARSNPFRWLLGTRARTARSIRARVHVAEDLQELFSIRLRGSGEGRGVIVLDEASDWLNARSWTGDDRKEIVRWFSRHRKLGWTVYLVVQDAEMIDKQVRSLCEYHVRLRNLRRVRVLWGLVPCTLGLFDYFVAIWTWHGTHSHVMRREHYRLSWHRKLYNTAQLPVELDGDGQALDLIWLPREDGQAPDAAAAVAGATSPTGQEPGQLDRPADRRAAPAAPVSVARTSPLPSTAASPPRSGLARGPAAPQTRTPPSVPAVDAPSAARARLRRVGRDPLNAQGPGATPVLADHQRETARDGTAPG